MAEQTESSWTESRFRQRLVGASVVVALAVLLLPLWLDGSGIDSLRVQSVPDKPEVKGVEEIDIPEPPGESGEPLANPPESLFPDQTPIEARSGDDGESMQQAADARAAASPEQAVTPSASATDAGAAEPTRNETPAPGPSDDKNTTQSSASPDKTNTDAQAKTAGNQALPASTEDGEFVVQLGSFSDERNAKALAASVESSGFDVFVEPLFSEQGTVWRVRVGPYATRELAGKATERLRQRIGRDGLVMTK